MKKSNKVKKLSYTVSVCAFVDTKTIKKLNTMQKKLGLKNKSQLLRWIFDRSSI